MKKRSVIKIMSMAIACVFTMENAGLVFAETVPNAVSDNSVILQDAEACEKDAIDSEFLNEIEGNYADDEVIVGFDFGDVNVLESCPEEYRAEADFIMESIVDPSAAYPFAVLQLDGSMTVAEAIEYYSKVPGVAYVQPNYEYSFEDDIMLTEGDYNFNEDNLNELTIEDRISVDDSYEANDPYISDQWFLSQIRAQDTWSLLSQNGATPVRVCVLDSGINLSNYDLKDVVDPNLCVSAVNAQYGKISTDSVGHGTHVSGIIAAQRDNGIGGAGVASGFVQLAFAQISVGSSIKTEYELNGINYAIKVGAKVVNMSWGSLGSYDPALKAACEVANDAGIVLVCAAGNDKNGTQHHYPSAFECTLGVIATGKDDYRATGFSNWGTDNFISAPGLDIVSTYGTGYKSLQGTSMAAPVVTGVIANMFAADPTLTPSQVRTILQTTSVDIYAAGFDADSGWGRIDCYAAVSAVISNRKNAQANIDNAPAYVKNANTADDFVKRLYYCCFNRVPADHEVAYWATPLKNRTKNGGEVAAGFIFSREYLNKNLDDSAYVDSLYLIFFGRTPDEGGKTYWLNELENGMSRQYVMNGFSGSAEFRKACERSGINYGQIALTAPRDQNPGVTQFVARLYTKALGRKYDEPGLNDWCNRILTHQMSPYDVAVNGFFHSPEFLQKSMTVGEFVATLYKTFFDRVPDYAGYKDWTNKINYYRRGYKTIGRSPEQVIAGFANSQEFANLMAKYGL